MWLIVASQTKGGKTATCSHSLGAAAMIFFREAPEVKSSWFRILDPMNDHDATDTSNQPKREHCYA
jgi:hypothetical protein